MNNKKIVYLNFPQYTFLQVLAKLCIVLWGRATGKTNGPLCMRVYDCVQKMPRSCGIWVVPSYAKLHGQLIQEFKKGMENLGMIEGTHYVIGKFFDKKLKIERPFSCPDSPKNFVHFANGAGMLFASLERDSTMGNGGSFDWLVMDEGKLCKHSRAKEALLTVRGNADLFGHLSCHHSKLIVSDKPTNSAGKWLLDFAKMHNQELIDKIIDSSIWIEKMKIQLENSGSEKNKSNLRSKIKNWTKGLNIARKKAVYVTEASTLENIPFLGIDVIRGFKDTLDDTTFQVSVLNKTLYGSQNDFYPLLDDAKHGYHASNIEFLNKLQFGKEYKRDCRWDADIKPTKPLEIAFDHNNAINWLGVSQPGSGALLKTMYVLKPKYIKDLVDDFCEYYKHHPNKTVHYYYNHTSKSENAAGDDPFYKKVKQRFKENGWIVIDKYYGKEPSHLTKYEFFGELFGNTNTKLPTFKYNIDNNEDWFIAMKSAKNRQGKTGFEKDKTSERDKDTPPQHATHATECTDCLFIGKFRSKIKKSNGEFTDFHALQQGSTASS